jgi:hypothetical protein
MLSPAVTSSLAHVAKGQAGSRSLTGRRDQAGLAKARLGEFGSELFQRRPIYPFNTGSVDIHGEERAASAWREIVPLRTLGLSALLGAGLFIGA